jgi:quercetin dioxygenase-like cupin family protein
MTRRPRLRLLVGSSLWLILALTVARGWSDRQQPAADDPRFTGKSTTLDATGVAASRRHFEAGARSAWHTHDRGQVILVEEGRARTQKRGQAMRELGPGESDYTPGNVMHWHGATPAQALTQAALTFGETRWHDKVTDAEYGSAQATPANARFFELHTYTASPGKLDALDARFRNHTNGFFARHGMTVVGYWQATDTPDTLIYLLAYKDRPSRDAAWKAFAADPEWIKARQESEGNGRLTTRIESVFLTPTDYSPMR